MTDKTSAEWLVVGPACTTLHCQQVRFASSGSRPGRRGSKGGSPCRTARVTASPATLEGGRWAKLPLPTLMPSNIIMTAATR